MTDNGHGPVPVQGHHRVLNIPQSFLIFKDVFLALRKLYFLCNKELLPCNYQKMIDDFRSAWLNLKDMFSGFTIPKLHILTDHLEDYFQMTDAILIKTSDELFETSTSIKGSCVASIWSSMSPIPPMVKDYSELYGT